MMKIMVVTVKGFPGIETKTCRTFTTRNIWKDAPYGAGYQEEESTGFI